MEGLTMEQTLLGQVAAQGVFAVLFVWLLFDMRKQAQQRESALMSIIEDTRKESAAREAKLMEFLHDITRTIDAISARQDTVCGDLASVKIAVFQMLQERTPEQRGQTP